MPIDPLTGENTPDAPVADKPAGLIAANINKSDPLSSVSGVTAAQRTLNPDTDTVQGQVKNIIADDSPLIQQAQTAAKQDANSRGLLNSSMAVQAGQEATYKAALPIAAADAGAYNQQGQLNQQANNRAAEVTAGATNAGAQLAETGKQALEQQTLRGTQAQGLADTEASYKTVLQSSASASSIFNQTGKNINDILADTTTSAQFKESAVAAQKQLLNASLSVIGSIGNLNLQDLLTFS